MQLSVGKGGVKDLSLLPKDLKVPFQDSTSKIHKKKRLFIKISLSKLFSYCRQRIRGMECGVYRERTKRKHSLRAISPLNHQHMYLPCLQLNRVGTHSHTHTHTVSPQL